MAALTLCATGSALAQDLDSDDCAAIWRKAQQLAGDTGLPRLQAEDFNERDGWCYANGLTLPPGAHDLLRPDAEYLRWRGSGLRDFAKTGAVPQVLEIELENLRLIPNNGNPVVEYVVAAQMARGGIDGSVLVSLDPETGTLELHRLDLRLPGDDGLVVTGRAEGIDLSSPEAPARTLATGAVHEIAIEARNETGALFEQTLLMPLANAFLNEHTPPETQVEEYRAEVLALIDALPEEAFPVETRFALTELVTDLPNPNGTFTLDASFEGGLGIGQAREAGADIAAIWRNATVKASYDRVALPH